MSTFARACLCAAVLSAAPALAQDTQAPTAVTEAMAPVPYGGVILLSGARSVDNVGGGKVTTYTWTRLSGEGGEFPLNQPRQTAVPTIELVQPAGNPMRPGSHRFQLQVTDSSGNVSSPATIDFLVVDNIAPIAILGAPASTAYGAPLTLHGEHSADIPGRIVQWRFSRIQGPDSPVMPLNSVFATLSGALTVSRPPAAILAPGAHVFRLVVVDDAGNQSAPRDITVTVAQGAVADTVAPKAVLDAPVTIGVGSPLTLSGARSTDFGGQVRRYEWMRLSGPGGAGMPLNQSFVTQSATFLVPQPAGSTLGIGRHRFRLAVEDTSGYVSQPVEHEVIVGDTVPPAAVLDAPGTLLPGEAFTLSGKRSIDGVGQIIKYTFTRISGSREGPMPLNQPLESENYFLNVPDSKSSPYALGNQVFRLTVMDDSGNVSQPVSVTVNVVASR